MSHIQFMLIEQDRGSKQTLLAKRLEKPNESIKKTKHTHKYTYLHTLINLG